MKPKSWEHFAHDADIGVRGIGNSQEEAFEQAALALTAVTFDPARIVARQALQIECRAPDAEILLADWLNALVYQASAHGMAFSRFEVRLREHRLTAKVLGEGIDLKRHRPSVEVKGATYTCLEVRRLSDGRWLAQCVVDV